MLLRKVPRENHTRGVIRSIIQWSASTPGKKPSELKGRFRVLVTVFDTTKKALELLSLTVHTENWPHRLGFSQSSSSMALSMPRQCGTHIFAVLDLRATVGLPVWSFLGWSRSLHSTETCRGRTESPGPAQSNNSGRSQSLVNHKSETRLSLQTHVAYDPSTSNPRPKTMMPRRPYQMIREGFRDFVAGDARKPVHGYSILTIKSVAT